MPAAMDKNSMDTFVAKMISRSFFVKAEKIKNGKEREDAIRKGISLTTNERTIAIATRIDERKITLIFPHLTDKVILPAFLSPSTSGTVVFR